MDVEERGWGGVQGKYYRPAFEIIYLSFQHNWSFTS